MTKHKHLVSFKILYDFWDTYAGSADLKHDLWETRRFWNSDLKSIGCFRAHNITLEAQVLVHVLLFSKLESVPHTNISVIPWVFIPYHPLQLYSSSTQVSHKSCGVTDHFTQMSWISYCTSKLSGYAICFMCTIEL